MRVHPTGFAAAAAILAAVGVTVRAQQAQPNALGQPLLDAQGHVREERFIRMPLRPEDQRYADLEAGRLKALLMEVDAISLRDRDSGRLFWGRNVGTLGHDATQAWVEAHFRRLGLQNVHRQPLPLGPQWMAKAYDLAFTSNGTAVTLASARPSRSRSTPTGGLDLELVWIGAGAEADFLGRDVRGKAVLLHDIPLPGDIRHSVAIEGAVERAFEKGAAAVGVIFGLSDNFAIWPRTGDGYGFSLGYADGMRLRDLLGRGQTVRVRYRLDSESVPNLQTAHVWGTLPGTTDEDVIILAHMDGYFQAALDNGSGLAVLIGLAEHLAKQPASTRRRSIRFMGSAGHHGGPGARYLHDNLDTAMGTTALVINLEHVAAVRTKYWGNTLRKTTGISPMRWWTWGSPRLLDVVQGAFQRFGVAVTADMDPGASGEMGSLARDLPTIQVITSPEVKHTEQDTPEWVPGAGLEQIARAYAKVLDEVDGLSRAELLPVAPSRTQAAR